MAKVIVMEKSFEEFSAERTAHYEEESRGKGKEPNANDISYKVARDYLKAFTANPDNVKLVEAIEPALNRLFKTRVGGGGGGSKTTPKAIIRKALKDVFAEAGQMTEQEVFMTSMEKGNAWGRTEMKEFIKGSINCAPEDRLWITLVNEPGEPMGVYNLVGEGPDAPEGWEGYVPVESVVEL